MTHSLPLPEPVPEEQRKLIEEAIARAAQRAGVSDRLIPVQSAYQLGQNVVAVILDDSNFGVYGPGMADRVDRATAMFLDLKTRVDRRADVVVRPQEMFRPDPGMRYDRSSSLWHDPHPQTPEFPKLTKKEEQANRSREKTLENVRRRPPRKL